MKKKMKNKVIVKSRHGDDRLFYCEDSKWFVDLKECHYVRFSANQDEELTAIDPDGGPFMAIGTNLSDFSSALPDIKIEKIVNKGEGIYQLTNYDNYDN